MRCFRRTIRAEESGGAAIEFAIIGPLFMALLLGMVGYGGWFWLGHAVQQLANDGARAAVGGLDAAERASLARTAVLAQVGGYPFLSAGTTGVVVAEAEGGYRVVVTADASRSPFASLGALLPSPPSTIERSAAIRLGGY